MSRWEKVMWGCHLSPARNWSRPNARGHTSSPE